MSKITSIVQIYSHAGSLFIVPVVQLENGPWQETFPIYQIEVKNVEALTQALAKIQQNGGGVVTSAPNPWNSEYGEALRNASALVSLRWFNNGTVKIVPQEQRISHDEDDGSIERGWYDEKAETLELAGDTSLSQISQRVIEKL
jgi:hypothetical protein